ncbi:hypothetical protein EVAR_56916_1 [Eumeta japonica]|uniref:Uncharacterized protein n=1 Tax=Eumeta variegata TaxID=151549 RepID=A0A4C1YFK4_EUMVA|nr:hypothetical protein EVAR_56916_1 [Eumeta japonica]
MPSTQCTDCTVGAAQRLDGFGGFKQNRQHQTYPQESHESMWPLRHHHRGFVQRREKSQRDAVGDSRAAAVSLSNAWGIKQPPRATTTEPDRETAYQVYLPPTTT